MMAHFAQARTIGAELGLGFAPLGFHPLATRAAIPWMPKGRYAIMRRYMPLMGRLGLDMMLRTCTVQVNLDYESEADMSRKLRVALGFQPLATALFANSPFTEGRPNGYLSYRGAIWADTDPDRTSMPAVMFENGFGFERYVEWLLDVPMYFVYRNSQYIDVAGRSFRDFIDGRVPELAGEAATIGDFADHVTTVFTDVRLKRFLEMRGADAGRAEFMIAQSALWVGLLYDEAALAAAAALVSKHERGEFLTLRREVPLHGLDTPWRNGRLRDLAHDVLIIAADGLAARKRLNEKGYDETIYLEPLREIIAGGPTQAEYWLERFHGVWGGDAGNIFSESDI
jgi:glutamate--cysteine ligase